MGAEVGAKAELWPRRSVAEPQGLVRTPAWPPEATPGPGAAVGWLHGLVVLAASSPADVQEGPRPGRGPGACMCPPEEPEGGDWS